jgi:hypothetical protein
MSRSRLGVRISSWGAWIAVPAFALALVLSSTARGDDRATAEAILVPLEHDAAHASITADAIKQARFALERATRMRDANDEPRARLAEGVGLRWAEVARDLVRAADVEQAANDARLAANDAGARAERERALLEEAIARQGRLHAELDALQSKQGPDRTAAVGASLDGGALLKASKTRGVDGGAQKTNAGEGGLLP